MKLNDKILSSKHSKAIIGSSLVASSLALGSSAFATGGTAAGVTTALTATATDITSTLTAVAPIGLGIAGMFLAWKYGMKFFKGLSK